MYQVITIGSALVDIFVHTHKFEVMDTSKGPLLCQTHGGKTEVDSFNVYTGGGGGNTAVGFARLGFKTAVMCETGRDNFSYLVIKDLEDQGVATNLIVSEKKEQTGGSVILICDAGERSVLVHRRAAAMLDPFDISAYWISESSWVHLASIGGREKTLQKIFASIKRSTSTKLSWNPGKIELMMLAEKKLSIDEIPCEIFLLNQEEWAMIENIQSQILSSFPYVVVTAGKRGGDVYYQQKHACHFPALSSQVTDTTGAGDSFATGFVAGIIWGKTPQEAATYGARNSASVVGCYGAKTGLLSKEKIMEGG
jgi:sugar/nucleoside kinase (ribokinase family)